VDDQGKRIQVAQAYSTPLSPNTVTLVLDGQFFNLSTELASALLHQIGNAAGNARAWMR
jgi:hypothetical protein